MYPLAYKIVLFCCFSFTIFCAQTGFLGLPSIKSTESGNLLDLSNKGLTATQLKIIIAQPVIYENKVTKINQIPRLMLKLNDNVLDAIPEELCNNPNIIYLALRNNQITHLPQKISQLVNLVGLDLTDNSVASIDSLVDLSYLEKLLLCGNSIRSLPESFSELESLELVDLSFNDLTNLPATLFELPNLKTVFLHGNYLMKVENLEEKITKLPALCFTPFIKMSRKDLMPLLTINFMESIDDNALLAVLNLSSQNLPSIHGIYDLMVIVDNHFVPLKLLKNLVLKLTANRLHKLPPSIGSLVLLRALHLGSNQLKIVSNAITKLINLHTLDLSWNHLEAIPDAIDNLKNLQALFLNNNQLQSLPDSLGTMTQLQRLSLKNNPLLEELPTTIDNLKNLKEFSIDAKHAH